MTKNRTTCLLAAALSLGLLVACGNKGDLVMPSAAAPPAPAMPASQADETPTETPTTQAPAEPATIEPAETPAIP